VYYIIPFTTLQLLELGVRSGRVLLLVFLVFYFIYYCIFGLGDLIDDREAFWWMSCGVRARAVSLECLALVSESMTPYAYALHSHVGLQITPPFRLLM